MSEPEFDRFAADYYEQHAASVSSSGEAPEFFHRYKVADVAAELAKRGLTPRRILDFGGGVGNSLGFMREAFPGSEIVLLDPSTKSLDLARGRYPGMARFEHFDGKRIPFPAGHFDLVFVACVFHHVPVELQIPLLKEINRVLGSNGSLFVFEHNPYNPLTLRAVRNCPFDEKAVLISAAMMSARLAMAGFRELSVTYRLFFPRLMRKLRLFERYLRWCPLGAQYYAHAIKG